MELQWLPPLLHDRVSSPVWRVDWLHVEVLHSCRLVLRPVFPSYIYYRKFGGEYTYWYYLFLMYFHCLFSYSCSLQGVEKLVAYPLPDVACSYQSQAFWLLWLFLANDTFSRLALHSERVSNSHSCNTPQKAVGFPKWPDHGLNLLHRHFVKLR